MSILISGEIDENLRKRIEGEINYYAETEGKVSLVINSPGGSLIHSMELARLILRWNEKGVTSEAKVYLARSGAGEIALSTKNIVMHPDGILGMHLGEITIERTELIGGQRISPSILEKLSENEELVYYLLRTKLGTHIPEKILTSLSATNRFVFNARECLELGIISRILAI